MIRTRLVPMGNSRGIRIPRPLIEQVGLTDEVEMRIEDGQLILRPAPRPRAGWDERFARMAERGDDQLLDEEAGSTSAWDEIEWEW